MKGDKELGVLVKTADGSLTIRNPDIDEEYHSTAGAAFESLELYIRQSCWLTAIEEAQDLRVLDVGLGLGYNALTTIDSWMSGSGICNVDMVSLEVQESLVRHLASGTAPWIEGWSSQWLTWAQSLKEQGDGTWVAQIHHTSGKVCHWTVIVGDSSKMELPAKGFHFVWQDAFSPKKNPELWSAHWFSKLAAVCDKSVELLTYSVARVVKDGLTEGGWDFERIPAPGKKKHWLKARLSP
ncbi:MnmC family methyltransferase [Pseudobacteriovorax antillogorgiicola]|uniref:tRNA U34 5-methylaminomethyl-2-thiouridine-forming methyltransferase MnmC n=1 Tax=Pseudobacteriovorax antillogorgiicola TaxID=1513793 RepID=A0A1Y6C510_9BACT|nr:MnmC family methyltransferase [Pseudobacteriovorax antillogorgiicola]TCS49501.1 tRNA U34 5-methylaminomethyl-2-thiouridine-forming methyltransferase MnmC [Pseudobacteriovorax antillogorgiicola]SMF45873.1 tRNA U34 5-methylaminomethyl-2-thiouridine-forming methyltransferase MnmC [Pseudobacteriovorax antillogorgiicola]